jgi:hypothetical protein
MRVRWQAIGIAAVGVVMIAIGRAAWRAWRRRRAAEDIIDWPRGEGPLAILYAATLATGASDEQPWRFEVHGDTIAVFPDPKHYLGAHDPFGRELHLAIGCALENIVLAARAQGYDARIETPPGRLTSLELHADEPAAIVRLIPGTRERNELFEAIPDRHAHAGSYRRRAVPKQVLHELRECVETSPALRLFLFTGRTREAFAERIVAAADDMAHADKRLAVHVATAPVLGMIAVKVPFDRPTTLAAGQCWERVQLLCTARGLVTQALDDLPELADCEHAHALVPSTVTELARLTGDATWHPAVVFRVGYARHPPHISPHRVPISVMERDEHH